MKLLCFDLTPFREQDAPGIKVSGTIGRRANVLTAGFLLLGNLSDLALPAAKKKPRRTDRLWERTCLELFLGVENAQGYWEFNLSPAGHWNAYRFAAYRKDMREEPGFSSLPFRVRRSPRSLRLSLDLDAGKIVPAGKAVEVGIGAVLVKKNGDTSHWALAHSGHRPDFHRRDGFLLTLSAAGEP